MAEGLRLLGCSIRVPDLERARAFYSGTLGFASRDLHGDVVVLPGKLPVFLERVPPGPVPALDQARTLLMLQVHSLARAAEWFAKNNIPLVTGAANPLAIGVVDCFRDPFGNIHSFVELANPPKQEWREPHIYNVGQRLPISAIPEARRIYSDVLGFPVRTDRYYPPALPMMNPDGSFAFVIYDKPSFLSDFRAKAALYPNENGCLLVFETADVASFRQYLQSRAPRLRITRIEDFALGRRMALIDNAGIASEIWELGSERARAEVNSA
jgi:catechol 2,3-dioxygenase-like lactoylglutathione lyase family enzyme